MDEETDKRERSTKPEVDDLTDYQSLNSLGGAGVAEEIADTGIAAIPLAPESEGKDVAEEKKDAPAWATPDETPASLNEGEPSSNSYDDGANFTTIDNKGRTNA